MGGSFTHNILSSPIANPNPTAMTLRHSKGGGTQAAPLMCEVKFIIVMKFSHFILFRPDTPLLSSHHIPCGDKTAPSAPNESL